MMKQAVAGGLIARSPCIDIELPNVVRKECRYLTENEVAALVDAMPGRYKSPVVVGAYLGLRWQEIAGLRRSAVSLGHGHVRVSE